MGVAFVSHTKCGFRSIHMLHMHMDLVSSFFLLHVKILRIFHKFIGLVACLAHRYRTSLASLPSL